MSDLPIEPDLASLAAKVGELAALHDLAGRAWSGEGITVDLAAAARARGAAHAFGLIHEILEGWRPDPYDDLDEEADGITDELVVARFGPDVAASSRSLDQAGAALLRAQVMSSDDRGDLAGYALLEQVHRLTV